MKHTEDSKKQKKKMLYYCTIDVETHATSRSEAH